MRILLFSFFTLAFFTLAFVTLSLCAAGCAPTLSPGAPCAFNSDCDEPLACRNARCRIACVEARDCGPGLRCVQSNEGPSCTLETEESCDATSPCPGSLRCVFGQCRSECIMDSDCSRDGLCDADGTCLEARSGTDGGLMRMDAGTELPDTPDAPACTPAPMICGNGTLEACGPQSALGVLTGMTTGEYVALTPHFIGGYTRPREGAASLPPEIALGLSGEGYGVVGYIGDGETRNAHFERFRLDDLSTSSRVAMNDVIDTGRTIVLGEHGEQVVGFVLLTEPPGSSQLTGWNTLFTGTGDGVARAISSGNPVGVPSGEMAIVGGTRSIGPSGSPLFYLARENKTVSTTTTPTLGAIDEGIGFSTYRATTTTALSAAHDYLTMGGSAGSVVVLHEPDTGVYGLWNVEQTNTLESYGGVAPDHVRDFAGFEGDIGGPAITQTGDGIYTVAVPTSTVAVPGGIDLYSVRCFDDQACENPVLTTTLATRSGNMPRIVRLAALRNGHALLSLESTASGPVAHLYLLDSNWRDVSGDLALPIATTAREQIVAVQLGSVFESDALITTVVVAALLRDETTTTDRVWLGGTRACITR